MGPLLVMSAKNSFFCPLREHLKKTVQSKHVSYGGGALGRLFLFFWKKASESLRVNKVSTVYCVL